MAGQIKKPYVTAIVLAGGSATRMKAETTKQRISILGMSVLKRSVLAFEKCEDITDIVAVVREDEVDFFTSELKDIKKLCAVCAGGCSCVESAKCGLAKICDLTEYVAIHDGARPLIRPEDISAVLEKAKEKGAAFAASPVYDTVKVVDNEGKVVSTPIRSTLVRATTPQIFDVEIYKRAISEICSDDVTDDNMLVERLGYGVYAVVLDNENPKITTKDDIKLVELLLGEC